MKDVRLPPFSHRLLGLFAIYLRRYFRRHFTAVRLSRTGPPPIDDRPVIFYSNHPSWWDPILYMLLGHALFRGREGYGPMDAAMLERYAFFRRLGVFGVDLEHRRGAAAFLRTAEAALARPRAMLWLTVEGQFRDVRQRPLVPRPGVAHLMRRVDGVIAVPLAIEYTFWNERLPEALIHFGPPIAREEVDQGESTDVAAWQDRLGLGLETAMDALAALGQARDPAAFAIVLDGTRGVGGIYDTWRRTRAATRGETFQAAHGTDPAERS